MNRKVDDVLEKFETTIARLQSYFPELQNLVVLIRTKHLRA